MDEIDSSAKTESMHASVMLSVKLVVAANACTTVEHESLLFICSGELMEEFYQFYERVITFIPLSAMR